MVVKSFLKKKGEMWDRMKWMKRPNPIPFSPFNPPPHKPPTSSPPSQPSPPHHLHTTNSLTKTKPTNPSPTASPKQDSTQVYSKASLNTHLNGEPCFFLILSFLGILILFNSCLEGEIVYVYMGIEAGWGGGKM